MQAGCSVEWQLRQWANEYPKRLFFSYLGEECRVQTVDPLQHQYAVMIYLQLRPAPGFALAALEIVVCRFYSFALEQPSELLLEHVKAQRFQRFEVVFALVVFGC